MVSAAIWRRWFLQPFGRLLTKKYEISTDVSLNTIMVDGTGMCGACRITVGGKTKFVCVDGPEFDGHEVDFDEMLKRLGAFKAEERDAMEKEHHRAEENKEEGRDAEWRKALRQAMKPKERMGIERVVMPAADPKKRARQLTEEVNQGLTLEMACQEAKRCLDCANPGCVQGCPVGIDIPSFIKHLESGDVMAAAETLKKTSALPAAGLTVW